MKSNKKKREEEKKEKEGKKKKNEFAWKKLQLKKVTCAPVLWKINNKFYAKEIKVGVTREREWDGSHAHIFLLCSSSNQL